MKIKATFSAVIPVVDFGNIQPEITLEGNDYNKLEKEAMKYLTTAWNTYGKNKFPTTDYKKSVDDEVERRVLESLKNFGEDKKYIFQEYETFTGEKVLYNAEKHEYRDLDGNVLLSGSQYAKSKIKKFDKSMMSFVVGKKYGVDKDIISDMWDANGNISATFGTALHLAMEQWFKNKENGTEKKYHVPKHPFLKKAVESFPLKDAVIWPELMISDVSRGFVGQIDGLCVTGDKEATIVDYKTDVEVEKNLEKHSHQLSFYKSILEAKGWKINKLEIWNYVDDWKCFELPVKEITL